MLISYKLEGIEEPDVLLCRLLLPPADAGTATDRHRVAFALRALGADQGPLTWPGPGQQSGRTSTTATAPDPDGLPNLTIVTARSSTTASPVHVTYISSKHNSEIPQMSAPKPECLLKPETFGQVAKMSGFAVHQVRSWPQSRCSGNRLFIRFSMLSVAFECKLTLQNTLKTKIDFLCFPTRSAFQ